MGGKEYILEMKGVSKSFPGVKALSDMNLKVRAGSVHVIMGENGAGKSTLMKILMGLYQADQGEIYFKGQKIDHHSPAKAAELGIAMIHQELNTISGLDVGQYLFLGREMMYKNKLFLNDKEMYRKADEYLRLLDIHYSARTKMRDLSQSETQLCEITKAVSSQASLIIMDEPTSAIADKEVEILFRTIRQLKERGTGIIYITHKIDEVKEIGDDITILRDGQWITTVPISDIEQDEIISLMVGRKLTELYPKEFVKPGEMMLEVRNLCGDMFHNISFQVRAGEIVGFSGLIGAGRTEVMQGIFGLDKVEYGEIILEGKSVSIHEPKDAIKNGIVLIPEDRKKLGLVLNHSVKDNIALPNYAFFSKGKPVMDRQYAKQASKLSEQFGVKTPSLNTKVQTLSGGNQQKVVLAKWMDMDIKVLIMDEPTRGIDVGAKAEIYKLMVRLAKKGIAIIMISSELPEILGMSDRIYIMCEGKISGEIGREDATQDLIMKYSMEGMQHGA